MVLCEQDWRRTQRRPDKRRWYKNVRDPFHGFQWHWQVLWLSRASFMSPPSFDPLHTVGVWVWIENTLKSIFFMHLDLHVNRRICPTRRTLLVYYFIIHVTDSGQFIIKCTKHLKWSFEEMWALAPLLQLCPLYSIRAVLDSPPPTFNSGIKKTNQPKFH